MNGTARQWRQEIRDPSQVGAARRQMRADAEYAGLSEESIGRASIVINELATNILKHAQHGELLVHVFADGVEVIAIDRGPGMKNIERCLDDGYSTTGTAGTGFGAVQRMSRRFDAWSDSGGSVVLARIGSAEMLDHPGAVCIALAGQTHCGDAWRVRDLGGQRAVVVIDGLGHGPEAAVAANRGCDAFDEATRPDAKAILEDVDSRMRGTRGGAVALACVDKTLCTMSYCGIGNISGRLETARGTRGLQSNNGIVGAAYRRAEAITYPWSDDALLVLHSDGLQTRWVLDAFPGLRFRHPAVIASVLYRDFTRGRDDTTVVVTRLSACQTAA